MRSTRVSYDEALSVTCPECQAPPHKSCVYLPLANYDENVVSRSWKVRKRILLTGTPTNRPHNRRFHVAWLTRMSGANARCRPSAVNESVAKLAATQSQRQIARAHQQWDREEWLRLTIWLRHHGHIFQEE